MTTGTSKARRPGNLGRLLGLLSPEGFRLAVALLLGVLTIGFTVIGPVFLGNATNIVFDGVISGHLPADESKADVIAGLRAHGHQQLATMYSAMNIIPGTGVNFTQVGRILGLVAASYILSALSGWALGYIMAGAVQRAVYRLRQAVEEKLARLPLRYFDSTSTGEMLSRVTNDIDNITTALNDGLSPLLASVLTVAATLGLMFWISPLLATVSLATIPLTTLLTSFIARRAKGQFIAQWSQTGQLNGLVEETHTGHVLVLAFGQRKEMIKEFERQNDELYQSSFRAQFLSGVIMPAVQFVGNLNYVVLAVFGGYQVAAGMISFGAVQAFTQYSRRFISPITQIASQMNVLQSGLASAERVFAFLDVPEEPAIVARWGGLPWTAFAARRIQLEHVSFRYEPTRPLIEDFTLTAEPGQSIAIVGPTGAGKTTVVNLLMRFYEIDGGRILLDGTDYQELTRDEVRSCFGMVLQDTWLFGGTIRDNIAYGGQGATDADVISAATAAHADDFIRTLPEGYATVLDGEASSISSGQKQLLTIARAFLANPGILILDEATSNIDARTETVIQDAMTRLRAGRTSFVIAHRLSTIRDADVIVVMDQGRVVEQGSHHKLLTRGGLYRALYDSQFSGGD